MNKLLKHKKKNKQKLMLIKLLTRTIIIRGVVGGLSHKSSRNNKKHRRKKINTNKKEIGKLLRVVDELFLPAESSATSSLQRDVIRKGKKVKTMLAPSCLHTEMLFFCCSTCWGGCHVSCHRPFYGWISARWDEWWEIDLLLLCFVHKRVRVGERIEKG